MPAGELIEPGGVVARHVMESRCTTLALDLSLADALAMLAEGGAAWAPVVDSAGRAVGLLGEREHLELRVAAAHHACPRGTVAEVVHPAIETVSPDADLGYLEHLFLERPHRRLVVVDEQRRVLGIVALPHVLRALAAGPRARAESRATRPKTVG